MSKPTSQSPNQARALRRKGTTLRKRLVPGGIILASALVLTGCSVGFGGDVAAADPDSSSSGANLSSPPKIEGDVVTEGDEHAIKFGIGLNDTSPQYLLSLIHISEPT